MGFTPRQVMVLAQATPAAARKRAALHFGLRVERDAKRVRFAGGLGVDAAEAVEEGVRLGEFF